jgi:hypothetical protein
MFFSPIVEGALKNISANSLTEFFLWVMALTFVLALSWKRQNKHESFSQYTPTLLTSLGMLGTFAGIICGLLAFDSKNIDGSISLLLDGLKTAFITSLWGMFLSILFKVVTSSGVLNKKNIEVTPDEVSAKDIFLVMRAQADAILSLQKTIGQNDDTSLIGQLKLLRADLNDSQKTVNKHLIQFGESLTLINQTSQAQHDHFKSFEDRLCDLPSQFSSP